MMIRLEDGSVIDNPPLHEPEAVMTCVIRHSSFVIRHSLSRLFAALLLTALAPDPQAGTPSIHPDEPVRGRICYSRKEADGYSLRVMDPDGRNDRVVLKNPGKAYIAPAWSPDATRVAFCTIEIASDNHARLYVADADGSNLQALAQTEQDAVYPAWAPDGKSLVISVTRDQVVRLATAKLDGSPPRELETGLKSCMGAFFSPDGKRLGFTAGHDQKDLTSWGLFVAESDGQKAERLALQGALWFGGPGSWSPDGSTLAIVWLDPKARRRQLFTYGIADRMKRQILDLGEGNSTIFEGPPSPSWSPDGKWLAASGVDSGGVSCVWRISPDGQSRVRLTPPNARCYSPNWSRS